MQNKNLSLQCLVLIFLLTNLFVLTILDYSYRGNCVYSSTNSPEDPNMKNFLWEIGRKNLSSKEFDPNPGSEAKYYKIPDVDTNFPRGLSEKYNSLPSEIHLIFSINQNHAKNLFSMHLFSDANTNLAVYFNSILITENEIYTGMGWEIIDISLPYISSGEHVITLKAQNTVGFVCFDYLCLTGFPDTDLDGICDMDEGEEDSDEDGLEDYLDDDCAFVPNSEGEKILLIARQKDDSEISSIPVLRKVSFSDIPSTIHNPVVGPVDIEFPYGFVSGRIDNPGKDREVSLLFSPPQSVNLYGVEQIWTYDDMEKNWVFTDATLDKETRMFHIRLKDGDPEDTDGEIDAHITFNLGLGIPNRLTSYSMNYCFLGLMEQK